MTLDKFLSQVGIGPKHLTERYSHTEYGAPTHDPPFYAFGQSVPSHGHAAASSKHHYGSAGHKNNAAMSALTLLSFLFFLHILQQCLREHMASMTTPPVMIMTAGRDGEEIISKSSIDKIDKSGITKAEAKDTPETEVNDKNKLKNENAKYGTIRDELSNKDFMKIRTAEYSPKNSAQKYRQVFQNYGNRSFGYSGYLNAMDDE